MYKLPLLTVGSLPGVAENSCIKPAGGTGPEMDKLEEKVVINTSLLLSSNDNKAACVDKLRNCLSDAIGLKIDFDTLLAA